MKNCKACKFWKQPDSYGLHNWGSCTMPQKQTGKGPYVSNGFRCREDFGCNQFEPIPKERKRLEYLRGELRAERISYDELHELQSLAPHIEPGDVELLEAAGVEEVITVRAKP